MPFPDRPLAEIASQNQASERDALSRWLTDGNCIPESSLRMGCRFRLKSRAESASQNPGNSVIRWLSKRRAKDAERKTYNENGVKTALRMA